MNATVALQVGRGFAAANGVRLALAIACIALGVALAVAVHTVHSSALTEIDRAARVLSGDAQLEIRGPRSGFDDALFPMVAARDDVAIASPVVEVQAAIAGRDESLRILGLDAFRAVRLQPAFLPRAGATGLGQAGQLLDPGTIWLSPAAAARLGLAAGDRVSLVAGSLPREYKVGGVLAGLVSGDVGVVDIAAAQAHFHRIGKVTRIELRLRDGIDARAFTEALAGMLPAGVHVSAAGEVSGRAADITRAYRVNLDALALVALATGAFLVFSTLALQAARRRQELALLRALGVTRRGVAALLAAEGAFIGMVGSMAGLALGLLASNALLRRTGGDLGAGFFTTTGSALAPEPLGLLVIVALGTGVAVAGALWVAHGLARLPVAHALRDRALDLSPRRRGRVAIAAVLAFAGVPLLFVPPIAGLPLAGYAAIGLWLAAAVVAVEPVCRVLLRPRAIDLPPFALLAIAQARHLPGHLAASIAGIVVSASLCLAMAIMVHSFRSSLEHWLHGVVGADLYVRAGNSGDSGSFTPADQQRVARLPGVAALEPLRYDRLSMPHRPEPLTLIARPITTEVLRGFQSFPAHSGTVQAGAVWITEAARDLHGWQVGDDINLPIAGKLVKRRVAGVVRDYARTWGAVLMPLDDYRGVSGDLLAHDLAVHLAPGADARTVQAAIRQALPGAAALAIEDAASIRRESLRIFDRSFAVTRVLEAIAILIGLAGVMSSFAAIAWSRRREFGVLRFLGVRRREILAMLAAEGAVAGAVGALVGLASGAAISLVLIHVVNRQSFHWGMEVSWPWATLALLVVGIVTGCALGARVSGSGAVRGEAVLAVKDDA